MAGEATGSDTRTGVPKWVDLEELKSFVCAVLKPLPRSERREQTPGMAAESKTTALQRFGLSDSFEPMVWTIIAKYIDREPVIEVVLCSCCTGAACSEEE